MSDIKHETLLISASLIIASCALLYSVTDSPKYNSIDAVELTAKTTLCSTTANSEKVNLNTAGIEELLRLEFIGEMKAQAIIDYREKNGAFRTVEEIMNVEGISTSIFEKNKDKLTV